MSKFYAYLQQLFTLIFSLARFEVDYQPLFFFVRSRKMRDDDGQTIAVRRGRGATGTAVLQAFDGRPDGDDVRKSGYQI